MNHFILIWYKMWVKPQCGVEKCCPKEVGKSKFECSFRREPTLYLWHSLLSSYTRLSVNEKLRYIKKILKFSSIFADLLLGWPWYQDPEGRRRMISGDHRGRPGSLRAGGRPARCGRWACPAEEEMKEKVTVCEEDDVKMVIMSGVWRWCSCRRRKRIRRLIK